MPVSIQRYNQHGRRHPNDRIIFIKALPGPDHETANDFLHRIAAICVPIMKANSLSVMTLEEHEPNREFVGRNFNAGEVVQLVLKAPSTGRFLPFRYVQMVMMHELAHCKQMNHSRAFWAVRNVYADELRQLWSKNYTGEGLWGRGRPLYADQYDEQAMPDPSNMFENLCGGTYRSRGRKRKRGGAKTQLTYAEKKKRRIEKKFGVNGQELGGDEELRTAFEKGKSGPKPRVAGSNRGRELRLQAMLFRAEQQKAEDAAREQEQKQSSSDDDTDEASDGESEWSAESEDAVKALDWEGNVILDDKDRPMVRMRETDDNGSDSNAQSEWSELGHIPSGPFNHQTPMPPIMDDNIDDTSGNVNGRTSRLNISDQPIKGRGKGSQQAHEEDSSQSKIASATSSSTSDSALRRVNKSSVANTQEVPVALNTSESSQAGQSAPTGARRSMPKDNAPTEFNRLPPPEKQTKNSISSSDLSEKRSNTTPSTVNDNTFVLPETVVVEAPSKQNCEACSMANSSNALVCVACGNVLDIIRLPRYWRCQSDACQGSVYINTADAGRCAVCSAPKPQ